MHKSRIKAAAHGLMLVALLFFGMQEFTQGVWHRVAVAIAALATIACILSYSLDVIVQAVRYGVKIDRSK